MVANESINNEIRVDIKLQKYAESMYKLATKHWAENVADPNKNTRCRIDWVRSQCAEYFFRGGIQLYWDRELNIKQKVASCQGADRISTYQDYSDNEILDNSKTEGTNKSEISPSISEDRVIFKDQEGDEKESIAGNSSTNTSRRSKTSSRNKLMKSIGGDASNVSQPLDVETCKVKLLDVGSCYNPFRNVEIFDVTAIDLAPSCDEVLQCDFLSLQVGSENIFSENEKQVVQLTAVSFDTIVFCLLLEYLPSPEQRYACCEKAYDLLKNGGLLLIITPDSKHVGANAKFMKSWRHVLSHLGFMRIKYEKLPHAHCLAFRKCFYKEVAIRWASLQKFSTEDQLFRYKNKIFIPQDFTTVVKDETVDTVTDDKNTSVNLYNELPYT